MGQVSGTWWKVLGKHDGSERSCDGVGIKMGHSPIHVSTWLTRCAESNKDCKDSRKWGSEYNIQPNHPSSIFDSSKLPRTTAHTNSKKWLCCAANHVLFVSSCSFTFMLINNWVPVSHCISGSIGPVLLHGLLTTNHENTHPSGLGQVYTLNRILHDCWQESLCFVWDARPALISEQLIATLPVVGAGMSGVQLFCMCTSLAGLENTTHWNNVEDSRSCV